MPIYMDRHDLPGVTLKDAAEAHSQDLIHQDKYSCKALTYWVDEDRENAFCLIEAPNKDAVTELHYNAHGLIPHEIIEVDSKLVKSFLGRIHDPESNTEIVDSAFRAIMVIESSNFIHRLDNNQFDLFYQRYHNSVGKCISKYNGKVVLLKSNSYLVSFKTVDDAVMCALQITHNIKYITPNFDSSYKELNIGISTGEPVIEKKELFEDAIALSTYLCEVVQGHIAISAEAKTQYQKEHKHAKIDESLIRSLKYTEEVFLVKLMDFVEKHWNNSAFNVSDFSTKMGYSKSQLNRNIKKLTGHSPNNFIKQLRLQRAMKLLYNGKGNISQIAFETGFNTPSYFSKCFLNYFGLLPSTFLKQYSN
ncbi:DUF4242 domain-containing protein [Hyunsoonleella sp. SJ7]|uniref:DUF4242 domain-containing protein n=1 Tax=Hyunsoonleella aquatilis TaxID=2762758 RepID=A0A923H9Z1_9FLAO|nr:nickel-binding protein [Hyunsoonleella aquatilis]MBC3759490.1 DUF4242 domain-containing protein [Hyunsoonleella aquatilis]